jgi:cysteine desulfurase/selenocysteine lyase
MGALASTDQIRTLKSDFPVLQQEVNGYPLIYFDNAATTQKPRVVIDLLKQYYESYNANIHRGAHYMADKATAEFEATRKSIQALIHASEPEEIVFTTGTTDSINLVARSLGASILDKGDEVIITAMEHHSNIVPWQMICDEKGAMLRIIPINDDGELDVEAYGNLLSEKTKIVSVVHISNSLGTVNPVEDIIRKAHNAGALVLVDGAQSIAHQEIDVQALDCDFYAFSLHKMFGPTGVGVLYGKRELLDKMPPYRGGGEMIREVTFEKTTYNDPPYKFEAGTPNIAGVIASHAAVNYLLELGWTFVQERDNELLQYATEGLLSLPGIRIIGKAKKKSGSVAFVSDRIHPFDIGMMLDARGIAVRTGHHCTQPVMDYFGIEGTVRASFSVYNQKEEIDVFLESLNSIFAKWR